MPRVGLSLSFALTPSTGVNLITGQYCDRVINKSRTIATIQAASVTIRTVPRSVFPRLIDWSARLFVLVLSLPSLD